jgi:ring-1,2-phenylacetyl-CoA epoxidase subunit PaaA
MLPSFFGRAESKNNEIYRKWGIKKRKNEEMLDDYLKMTHELVVNKLNLELRFAPLIN